MPPKTAPKCASCEKTDSLLWRTVDDVQICHECYQDDEKSPDSIENPDTNKSNERKLRDLPKDRDTKDSTEINKLATIYEEKRLRKSTRATRFKAKTSTTTSATSSVGNGGNASTSTAKTANKGRNRRNLFKRAPLKTNFVQATTHSVESVIYKNSYLQVGDIVSLVDHEDNVYYAQIRGLLVDSYAEKSAFLTWLIPTQASPNPKNGFDAATYTIGPDEDLSRRLSCLEFVMHAPSNYYLDRTTPYPLPDAMEVDARRGGYIWTTLASHQRKNNNKST